MYRFSSSTADLLKRPDEQGQLKLLKKLYSKAESAADLDQLLFKCPHCLSAVVKLLSSSSVAVQEQAARVLGRFAEAAPTYQHRVVQCEGAVAGLVNLLHCDIDNDTVGVQREACEALTSLVCKSPGSQERVGQEPLAVTYLARLLQSGAADVQRAAVLAIVALTDQSAINSQRVGMESGVIKSLAAMLKSSDEVTQELAAVALANLAFESPPNSKRISQVPGIINCLVSLLNSGNAAVQWAAAIAMASAAEGSSAFGQALEAHSAAVGAALYQPLDTQFQSDSLALAQSDFLEVSRLLHRLAAGSTALRQSMAGSKEIMKLVKALELRLNGIPDNMAAATLALLATGVTATPAAPDQSSTTPSGPSSSPATTGGSAGAALMPAARPRPHNARDAAAARDQGQKPPSRPSAKLATTAALLDMLNSYTKDVPFLAAFIKPLTGFLKQVEQVRVNKAKAWSMKKRVDALVDFLVCILSAKELWHGELARKGDQLAVLQKQLTRLGEALKKAEGLVSKWSKPMMLEVAVRFLKADLDRDDIKDFENTINKAMQDLGTVMSGLNLLHTLEVKHQLQLLLSEAHVSQVRLDQQLHLAHEQDLQQLRGQLEQLLGGQAELSQQLAAATEQQRQEWVTVAGNLQQLVVEMGVIRNEVKELADAVRAWMDGCGNGQASSSSSSGLVRSRLMLGREQVQWDANAPVAQGGFANVYYGTFDGHPVAVKLLRLSAFDAEEQREQMYREAAVLSRLNHPCIVHFWGVVPVDESKPQQDAPQRGFAKFPHDSAGSLGSSVRWAARPGRAGSSRSKLSLGLLLDRCDGSLEDVLQDEPLLPLPAALHIAERIACGLKYLHSEAPLRVVHGDLKPANVLLKHGANIVQLTDFGLSHTIAVHTMSVAAGKLVGQNGAGQSGWTLHWAAPELLEGYEGGDDEIDPTFACDVYAFGIILHQLLVGKMPYVGMFRSLEKLKSAVRGGNRPSWDGWDSQSSENGRGEEAGPDVLSKLKALVEACWAQDAKERPTAQHVHTQLVELKRTVAAV